MTTTERTIFDKKVNGITWKVVGTVLLAFITIGWRGNKAYNDILTAIENRNQYDVLQDERSNSYNALQDLKMKALQVQVDKLEIEVKEIKNNRQH